MMDHGWLMTERASVKLDHGSAGRNSSQPWPGWACECEKVYLVIIYHHFYRTSISRESNHRTVLQNSPRVERLPFVHIHIHVSVRIDSRCLFQPSGAHFTARDFPRFIDQVVAPLGCSFLSR